MATSGPCQGQKHRQTVTSLKAIGLKKAPKAHVWRMTDQVRLEGRCRAMWPGLVEEAELRFQHSLVGRRFRVMDRSV